METVARASDISAGLHRGKRYRSLKNKNHLRPNAGVQKYGRAARPKSLRAPDEEIFERHKNQSQRVLQVDLQKKIISG